MYSTVQLYSCALIRTQHDGTAERRRNCSRAVDVLVVSSTPRLLSSCSISLQTAAPRESRRFIHRSPRLDPIFLPIAIRRERKRETHVCTFAVCLRRVMYVLRDRTGPNGPKLKLSCITADGDRDGEAADAAGQCVRVSVHSFRIGSDRIRWPLEHCNSRLPPEVQSNAHSRLAGAPGHEANSHSTQRDQ